MNQIKMKDFALTALNAEVIVMDIIMLIVLRLANVIVVMNKSKKRL